MDINTADAAKLNNMYNVILDIKNGNAYIKDSIASERPDHRLDSLESVLSELKSEIVHLQSRVALLEIFGAGKVEEEEEHGV